MPTQIQGGSSTANVANVDANYSLQATGPTDPDQAGFAILGTEQNPAGSGVGRATKALEADPDYRLRVGADSEVFYEPFLGGALNSTQWSQNLTSMTNSVANTALTLNDTGLTLANVVSRVQSYATFPNYDSFDTYFSWEYIYPQPAPVANNTLEMGAFFATGTTAPTDGIFLRYTAAGTVECVLCFNSTEASVTITAPTASARHRVVVTVNVTTCDFWIDDVLVASIETPAGRGSPIASAGLPMTFRTYNAGSVPAVGVSPQIFGPGVSYGSLQNNRDTQTTAALAGAMACQGQTGGTIGQTASYANSAAPASATLSNTAAGYTTLGGQFQFAAVAGAETDYALFAYQVPAAAALGNNKKLILTAVRISTFNTGAAGAGTATVLQWVMAVGATAVSLATVEGTATKAPRRITLGGQNFPVGAAIGAGASPRDVVVTFGSPLVVNPGEYVHVILKMPISTATASQVIRGIVAFDGYWE